jgi:hypothetical protein
VILNLGCVFNFPFKDFGKCSGFGNARGNRTDFPRAAFNKTSFRRLFAAQNDAGNDIFGVRPALNKLSLVRAFRIVCENRVRHFSVFREHEDECPAFPLIHKLLKKAGLDSSW